MKKKIILIHNVSSIGGSGNQFIFIIKSLIESNKFNIQVCLKDKGPISEIIEKLGVKVTYLNYLNSYPYCKSFLNYVFYIEILKCIKSYFKLKNYFKNQDYDLIYFNSLLFFYYLPFVKKSVIHVRENWYNKKNMVQYLVISELIKKSDCSIIYINKALKNIYKFQIKYSAVIYDFIDFKKFSVQNRKRDGFLFLGGISKIKGIKEVLTALKDLDTKLKILGGTNNKRLHFGIKGKIKMFLYKLKIKFHHDKTLDLLDQLNSKCDNYDFTHDISGFYNTSLSSISFTEFPHALLSIPESLYNDCNVICKKDIFSVEYGFESKNIQYVNNIEDLQNKMIKRIAEKSIKTEEKIKNEILKKFSFDLNKYKVNLFLDDFLNESC
jgi:glycosyltransferase involved in cell wall biosynthesis